MIHVKARFVLPLMALMGLSTPAFALCSSYPNTLTNGTTADGGQTMANFNCAVLQSGATIGTATLTGTTTFPGSSQISSTGMLGIGMTPGNPIDITKSQNADTRVVVLIATNGASASARLDLQSPDTNHSLTLARYPSSNTGTLFGLSLANTSIFIDNSTSSSGLLMGTSTSTPLIVGINNVERARWGTDGSFLVGTTTNGGWNGVAKAEIKNTSGYALSVYSTASTGGPSALAVRVDNTAANLLYFNYSGSSVGTITTNGTSTAYNTTSDERLKDVLPKQTDYRSAIEKLWVGDFAWKSSKAHDFGVRAQQAYALFPYAIAKPSDSKKQWQADYGKLAPLALWGVKDIYKLVDSQKSEIAKLRLANDNEAVALGALKSINERQATQLHDLQIKMSTLERKVGVRTALK
jgi:hypothetical protein